MLASSLVLILTYLAFKREKPLEFYRYLPVIIVHWRAKINKTLLYI
jgi:hypothetical protein